MKWEKSGWLSGYLTKRKYCNPLKKMEDEAFGGGTLSRNIDRLFYSLMQPTGLIYGYPIRLPDEKAMALNSINSKSKLKLILTESLIQCGILCCDEQADIRDTKKVEEIVVKIGEFYSCILGEQKSFLSFLSRKKNGIGITEDYIEQHISIKTNWRNFWTSFFSNSLIFLDVLYFYRWMKSGQDKFDETLKAEREEVFLLILKIIAATAFSDKVIQKEEELIFDYFMHSASLSGDNYRKAKDLLKQKLQLEDIDFSCVKSWLLKKYLLDIAVLTVWANREVEESEEIFLQKLIKKLNMTDDDLENSMLAIETFVLQNWEEVHYLQQKDQYRQVTVKFKNRVHKILLKNKKKLMVEIQESKELVFLMNESRKRQLTKAEKQKVKNQLLDIMKTIPSLAIFLLPMGSVILPVLLKVLPQNVLIPSAFQDKNETDQ